MKERACLEVGGGQATVREPGRQAMAVVRAGGDIQLQGLPTRHQADIRTMYIHPIGRETALRPIACENYYGGSLLTQLHHGVPAASYEMRV